MISAKPTENLAGISIEGDHEDFYEMMKWHSMILPRQEVHFSVNIMFPEAVFVALSAPELYVWSSRYYGQRTKKQEENAAFTTQKYSYYVRDKAEIDVKPEYTGLIKMVYEDKGDFSAYHECYCCKIKEIQI